MSKEEMNAQPRLATREETEKIFSPPEFYEAKLTNGVRFAVGRFPDPDAVAKKKVRLQAEQRHAAAEKESERDEDDDVEDKIPPGAEAVNEDAPAAEPDIDFSDCMVEGVYFSHLVKDSEELHDLPHDLWYPKYIPNMKGRVNWLLIDKRTAEKLHGHSIVMNTRAHTTRPDVHEVIEIYMLPPNGAAFVFGDEQRCAGCGESGAGEECFCGMKYCTDLCLERARLNDIHTEEDCKANTIFQLSMATKENRRGMNEQYADEKKRSDEAAARAAAPDDNEEAQ